MYQMTQQSVALVENSTNSVKKLVEELETLNEMTVHFRFEKESFSDPISFNGVKRREERIPKRR